MQTLEPVLYEKEEDLIDKMKNSTVTDIDDEFCNKEKIDIANNMIHLNKTIHDDDDDYMPNF